MIKKYKVYYLDDKPMIRLSNNLLRESNFEIGDDIIVSYENNKIIINKEDKIK